LKDPYIFFAKNEISSWTGFYEYFRSLCHLTKSIYLNKREVSYLSYFAKNPSLSAYDIEPGNKRNQSNYRYAKLTLKKFRNLKLVKQINSGKARKKGKHPSKKCSLTDHGVFFLLSRTELSRTMLLQDLFKNYPNLNIFQYLVYPYISLETICSPQFDLHYLTGVGRYLRNIVEKIELKVLSLEKVSHSDREIYFWNYNKLESYLRKSHHYNFLDYLYSEENSYDFYQEIRYFDVKNKKNDVLVRFDKKNKKGYLIANNRRIRNHEIPFIFDYVSKKIIPYYIDVVRRFHSFCRPSVEEFVLSVFPFFKIITGGHSSELLMRDRLFKNAIKTTKNSFDNWYNRTVTSISNSSF